MMLTSSVCFVANVLLIRALGTFETASIWLVTFVRFVVGVLVIVVVYSREWQPRRLYQNRKLVGRGILGGLTAYGFYLTIVHLGAGRASFINNMYVIFGALCAAWILGERLRAGLVVGSVTALIGLGLLTDPFSASSGPTIYDGVAVLTALAAGYVVVTIRQLHATEHTSTIFAAQCIYGLAICVIPAAYYSGAVSPIGWIVMIIAAIFAATGQITMTHAFRDLPVAEGSLLQMLVPLGVAAGGVVFFSERFAAHELTGAALILGGTTYTAIRRA